MQTTVQHNVAIMPQKSMYSHIQKYLRSLGNKSGNTEAAYENDIRQFFLIMKNKEIENLTHEDILLSNEDMVQYQTFLCRDYIGSRTGKRLKNASISRKIESVISLYKYLFKNRLGVNPEELRVDKLPDDTETRGILTVEEVEKMISCSKYEDLAALMMLALRTGLRKEALLELKWSQIKPIHDKEQMYLITTIDKGKKVEEEIHQIMYDKLISIKSDEVFVFITPLSTMDYRFNKLRDTMKFPRERKISFHSIKKAGIEYTLDATGNLYLAQRQGNHSSPTTTANSYLRKERNFMGTALDVCISDDIFDEMTKEELVSLLKNASGGMKHKLKVDAKKIVEGRE